MDSKKLQEIAFLSRLRFDNTEIDDFVNDFNKIMTYVDTIKELDTSSIQEDDLYPNLTENSLRKDEIGTSLLRDDISKVSPRYENGFVVVPRVIET
jgi:aspartyl-tRNA(Asn)/glutamyl-tRNA(Gln) amidotransferase subunit C